MIILGTHHIVPLLTHAHFSAKMVFNTQGVILFPVSREHRDQKSTGISYEDNYKGNALAAMLFPNLIETRYHQDFSDDEVARIISMLRAHPELEFMSGWNATYQGRPLGKS